MVHRAEPLLSLSADSFLRKCQVWSQAFQAIFGLSVESSVDLWLIVGQAVLRDKLTKIHFLWCLNFFKEYTPERSAARRFKTSPSNWRDKIWRMISVFNQMDEIHFEDRFEGWPHLKPSCYVDGIDCLINEAGKFNKQLFSHKFNHAGLRYQVATAIGTSKIVHVSGGVAGDWSDLAMVRHSLVPLLTKGEKVAADSG
ncbi:hypothetical protein BDR26DRAFT_892762 [Obelidium mucronatum]|nr:hypothetical protein BDR26DRAFT_892762 [Obelidium mucronatum]